MFVMVQNPSESKTQEPFGRGFFTTRWSIVLAASRDRSPAGRQALATLCETYWYPLYAFVRRLGYDVADAQDLTQAFFARLLDKGDLQGVRRERGRFRSFLLASIKHFLINEWDKCRSQKRGGGRTVLSLDFATAERRYGTTPVDERTPDAIFERQWALSLLDRVKEMLQQEFAVAGKAEQFARLQIHMAGEAAAGSYAQTAEELRMSEAAVKVAVHRLRRKFRDRLRDEIAQTVDSQEEVDDEICRLFETLRS